VRYFTSKPFQQKAGLPRGGGVKKNTLPVKLVSYTRASHIAASHDREIKRQPSLVLCTEAQSSGSAVQSMKLLWGWSMAEKDGHEILPTLRTRTFLGQIWWAMGIIKL